MSNDKIGKTFRVVQREVREYALTVFADNADHARQYLSNDKLVPNSVTIELSVYEINQPPVSATGDLA